MKNSLPLVKIKKLIDLGAAPGCSISISTANGEIESFSYGLCSDLSGANVGDDTIYDLASITKLFTTALILKFHDRRLLSIYDPCAKYLSNFVYSKSSIRLIDLLTHKVDFNIMLSTYREIEKDNLIESLLKIIPPHLPSGCVHYANLGFIYLGKIIEKVSGADLNNVFHRLFNDLGLMETFTGFDVISNNVCTPPTEVFEYKIIQNITHDETSRLLGGVAGNAGVFSSSRDLAKFGRAWLFDESFVSSDTRKLIFQDYDTSGLNPQAIGWWMRTPVGGDQLVVQDLYTHTGFTGCFIAIDSKKEIVCTFTCNRTYYGRGNNLHKEVWKVLIEWMQSY